jgi:hypothetical protein
VRIILRGRELFTLPPREATMKGSKRCFSDPYAKAIRDRAARLADD